MSRKVTAIELEELLQYLGFRQVASIPGSHKAFKHDPSNAVVVLGWIPPDGQLNPSVVVGIRRLLDEKGVINRDSFDRKLENLSAKRVTHR
jgi:predicted RNA binding protein YcfA (HicA-like mRNA interferase family)